MRFKILQRTFQKIIFHSGYGGNMNEGIWFSFFYFFLALIIVAGIWPNILKKFSHKSNR